MPDFDASSPQGGLAPALAQPAPSAVLDITASDRGGGLSLAMALLLSLAFAALAAPVLMVGLPPALDFPNHYARLWLVAGGIHVPPLASYYAVDWVRATVNIGGDLMAAAVGGIVGRDLFPRLLLVLSIVLPPLGGLLLHRRVFRSAHWWELTFPFAGWGMVALVGFMNFQIGVGLALVAAALDGQFSRRLWSTIVGRAACAVAILLFHPFAAVFYVSLVTALALGADVDDWLSTGGFGRGARRVLLALVCTCLPIAIMLVVAPNPVPSGSGGLPLLEWAPFTVAKKISILTTGFRSYSPPGDLAVALAVGGLGLYALVRRQLAAHTGLLLLAIALVVASILMPTRIGESYWVDRRLPVMAFLVLLAAVRPDVSVARQAGLAIAVLLCGITLVRTSAVASEWIAAQRDVKAMGQALAAMPEGCRMITVVHTPSTQQIRHAPRGRYFGNSENFWNYPAMAVPWRHAFVPNLFSQAGQQPLKVLAPWTPLSSPLGPPPPISALYKSGSPLFAYARQWRRFDYLMVLNADMPDTSGARLPLEQLHLVANEGFAVLYQVTPEPGTTTPATACKARPA